MKKLCRFHLLAASLAFLVLGLIGCGGGGVTPTPTPTPAPSPSPEESTDAFALLRSQGGDSGSAASLTQQQLHVARRAAKTADNRQALTIDPSPANIYIFPLSRISQGQWSPGTERKITDAAAAYTSVHLSLNRTSIVFAKTVNGYNQIFTSTVPVADETLGQGLQLTSDAEQHWTPHISADGSKVVFTKPDPNSSGGLVCIMNNAAGATEHCLDFSSTTPMLKGAQVRHASWSPDGKKIAFESWGGPFESDEIFMVNADGSALTQITSNAGTKNYDECPSVSGDGINMVVDTWNDATQHYELTNIGIESKQRDKFVTFPKMDPSVDLWDPLLTRSNSYWVSQQPGDKSLEIYMGVFLGSTQLTNNASADYFDSSSR